VKRGLTEGGARCPPEPPSELDERTAGYLAHDSAILKRRSHTSPEAARGLFPRVPAGAPIVIFGRSGSAASEVIPRGEVISFATLAVAVDYYWTHVAGNFLFFNIGESLRTKNHAAVARAINSVANERAIVLRSY